jgi:hypothetical protein
VIGQVVVQIASLLEHGGFVVSALVCGFHGKAMFVVGVSSCKLCAFVFGFGDAAFKESTLLFE